MPEPQLEWCEWECSWCGKAHTTPCRFFAVNKPYCDADCIATAGAAAMREAEKTETRLYEKYNYPEPEPVRIRMPTDGKLAIRAALTDDCF